MCSQAFNYYPKDIHPFAPSLLTSCWNLFQEGVEPYLKQCVLLMEARGQNDSESETSIASVVLEITELLSLVVSTERYRCVGVGDSCSPLLHFVIT